jgi:hypothetical protein
MIEADAHLEQSSYSMVCNERETGREKVHTDPVNRSSKVTKLLPERQDSRLLVSECTMDL